MKNVLAVHDISCIGRCSLTVALPIISSYGVECRVLPTALLSTHTGFEEFTCLDLTDEMTKIIDSWQRKDMKFDSIYSGFLASEKQIDILKNLINESKTLTVIDPVMADNGKLYKTFDDNFVEKMRELVPLAHVLTPNLTEACLLTGTLYQENYDKKYVEDLITKLTEQGAKNIVLTGISLKENQIGVAVHSQGKIEYIMTEKIAGHYHGTGDIFGSVLTAHLVKGISMQESAQEAVDFVVKAIKEPPKSSDSSYGLHFEEVLNEKK